MDSSPQQIKIQSKEKNEDIELERKGFCPESLMELNLFPKSVGSYAAFSTVGRRLDKPNEDSIFFPKPIKLC